MARIDTALPGHPPPTAADERPASALRIAPSGFRAAHDDDTQDEDSTERWLLSYADFITLLMVLFMMLYALQLVKTKDLNAPPASTATQPALTSLMAELAPLAERGDIGLNATAHGLEIEISAGILFNSGDTRLLPRSKPILDLIATALGNKPQRILVEGHADSQPIASPRYDSNWELSSARAGAVVRHFIGQGIAAYRLSAVGRADTVPAALGDSPEARARNRRVTILVQS